MKKIAHAIIFGLFQMMEWISGGYNEDKSQSESYILYILPIMLHTNLVTVFKMNETDRYLFAIGTFVVLILLAGVDFFFIKKRTFEKIYLNYKKNNSRKKQLLIASFCSIYCFLSLLLMIIIKENNWGFEL